MYKVKHLLLPQQETYKVKVCVWVSWEVENNVLHNSLQGKTFDLVPNEVDNLVFHGKL